MPNRRFAESRFFLKDSIRQQVDFARTAQSLHEPAPPLQKPCPADVVRLDLPDGAAALARLGRLPVGEAIARRQSLRDYSAAALSMGRINRRLDADRIIHRIRRIGTINGPEQSCRIMVVYMFGNGQMQPLSSYGNAGRPEILNI